MPLAGRTDAALAPPIVRLPIPRAALPDTVLPGAELPAVGNADVLAGQAGFDIVIAADQQAADNRY